MRRFARRLFTLCSAASLLLCVSALLVRNFLDDGLYILRDGGGGIAGGGVRATYGFTKHRRTVKFGWTYSDVVFERGISVHLPFVATTAAALPLWWAMVQVRRKRQPAPGLCPACGYDLRATLGRCPECGTVPEVTA